jgi:hypothetical protein
MVGFGFMDNLVMIQAGDLIDNSIGVRFALSTLTAAAFGQIFSDVAGVLSGSTVEALATKLGLPKAGLTQAQYLIPRVKTVATIGQCVGVVIGCLLGMCSLLFMDLERAERLKKQAELGTLFETLLDEGGKLIEAERCTLFLVDELPDGKKFLWSKTKTGVEPSREDLMRSFKLYDRAGRTPRSLPLLTSILRVHLISDYYPLAFSLPPSLPPTHPPTHPPPSLPPPQ